MNGQILFALTLAQFLLQGFVLTTCSVIFPDHSSLRHGGENAASVLLTKRMEMQAGGRMAELDKQIFEGYVSTGAMRLELLAMEPQQRAQYAQLCNEPIPFTAIPRRQDLETHWKHHEAESGTVAGGHAVMHLLPVYSTVPNVARGTAVDPLILTRYGRKVSISRIYSLPDLT